MTTEEDEVKLRMYEHLEKYKEKLKFDNVLLRDKLKEANAEISHLKKEVARMKEEKEVFKDAFCEMKDKEYDRKDRVKKLQEGIKEANIQDTVDGFLLRNMK